MKKIIVSLSIIGLVMAAVISGTVAYFSDTETSTGNTFSAGEIDLKVDLQCDWQVGCGFPLRDLDGDPFFHNCDVKPGDQHEATISFHVYNNNAWGRIKIDPSHTHDYEYGCTEPESEVDATCGNAGDGEGELSQNILFTIWLDQGSIAGWQCAENDPACETDPEEGDNQLNGIETALVTDIPMSQLINDWYVFPEEIIASNTYYVGVSWRIPSSVGNIIQTDSLTTWIVMQVVQSRNNPNKDFE